MNPFFFAQPECGRVRGNRSRRAGHQGSTADNLTTSNVATWTKGRTPGEESILAKADRELHRLRVQLPPIRSTPQMEEEHFFVWQAWEKTLSPDELVLLKRLSLSAPEHPSKTSWNAVVVEEDKDGKLGTCDHLESSEHTPFEALVAKEREAGIDQEDRTPSGRFKVDAQTKRDLVVLSVVLAEIIDAKNPRLVASIMALAIGIGARQRIEPYTLAKKHKVGLSWLYRKERDWRMRLDVSRVSMAMLKLVISPILASRNPRLEADTIAMAARFGLSGGASMTALGEHHGVCKAAVSARVRRWVKDLGLPLPRECKQQTSNYLLSNVRREAPKSFVA